MSKEKIGRIGCGAWMTQRASHVFAVYNADYSDTMQRIGNYADPWFVAGPSGTKNFTTHAEALAWAFEKAEAGE